MRKNAVAIILVSFLVLFAGTYIFSIVKSGNKSPKKDPSTTTNTTTGVTEPPFRHDANLYIFDQNGQDTLADFDIEIVTDEYGITTGLMYRRSMLNDRGMLFIFPDIRPRSFWMKNTHIPLDIIFIDDNYRIVTIQPNTKPFSEQSIPSYKPAKYVLEVNAGTAAKLKWKEGDILSWATR
ncbi:MAG: DUF192 domain-containing protein [Bacteroidetes bacterium]|nr:MAG: DUF192 domain-containing protein [Bacteroidota bacterium]